MRHDYAASACAAAVASCLAIPCSAAGAPMDKAAWRAAIAATPHTEQGCYTAAYPSLVWRRVACVQAPAKPYVPRTGGRHFTVGDGNDYAAVETGLISATTGTFPRIRGLTSESDGSRQNVYSLQINSQFFASPTCAGAAKPKRCQGWEQFVYSSGERSAFMQYWLIHYDAACPSGWNIYASDCYRNSAAVQVPQQVITQLGSLVLQGAAAADTDTLTMTADTQAYSTSGPDSVVDLAAYWMQSEFNIVGDGGGSEADFNTGTALTVKIALAAASAAVPVCQSDDGTTGETNNLNLGACSARGGRHPYVKFLEKT